MDFFLAGTTVECVIPLVAKGVSLDVDAIDYRILDENNAELQASTRLEGFTMGTKEAQIVVPASLNQIAGHSQADMDVHTIPTRAARLLELHLTLESGNQVVLTYAYGLEPVSVLIPGVNSFQTYAQAQLMAAEIPGTPGWDAAADEERYAAMIEARWHLVKLSYYLLNSNINFGQDSLNFVPEGVYQSKYVATNGLFMFDGNLELLSAEQFNALPERFKGALRKAQVAEADFILTGDPMSDKRLAGITSDTVGQTHQSYRSTKPLDLPCCKRALSYVSYFVQMNKRLART
jgi:hypothetical protein